nr:serine/threonine-protein kinase srpk [Quercus suber]
MLLLCWRYGIVRTPGPTEPDNACWFAHCRTAILGSWPVIACIDRGRQHETLAMCLHAECFDHCPHSRVSMLQLWCQPANVSRSSTEHSCRLGRQVIVTTTASIRSDSIRNPVDVKLEEERLPGYKAERYYPVRIEDVFHARYKVLAKLGFGGGSTVRLCRDLQYVLCSCCQQDATVVNNEVLTSRHIATVEGEHIGRQWIRLPQDEFEIESDQGRHQCLVFPPMGMTFTELRNMLPDKTFSKEILQRSLHPVAVALDFMHQAGVVHTGVMPEHPLVIPFSNRRADLSPNNILLGLTDSIVLSDIENAEIEKPSFRKESQGRCIYASQGMPITSGSIAISDFGAAKIGDIHTGDVMPAVYRAPKIIMNMQWDCKIDTWAFGVMIWDLFEGGRLFRAVKDNIINDELHVAEMVSLMGPPSKAFLERSQECNQYWDSEETPVPDQSLETREGRLEGADEEMLLKLVRKLLRWLPEERASAYDVFEDDFIVQYLKEDDPNGK